MKLVVVTGVAGAGKTTAMHALEDLHFYCADNMPLPLLPKFIELLSVREDIERAAVVVDARSGEFLENAGAVLADVRASGHDVDVLFLDASDEVLLRRFSETRRRHPLSETSVRTGLRKERTLLAKLRNDATSIVDTSRLSVHKLRAHILETYGRPDGGLSVVFLSFGFKHGLPVEADMVLDVRFLPNPYFVAALSPRDGRDTQVRDYVLDNEEARAFLDRAADLLKVAIHGFRREGKAYATVAIGCTGGRHRSVAVAEELARRFAGEPNVGVRHRDLARGRRTSPDADT